MKIEAGGSRSKGGPPLNKSILLANLPIYLFVAAPDNHYRVNTVSPGTVDWPMLDRFLSENATNIQKAKEAFDRLHPSVLSPKYEVFCRRSVGCFSRRERSAHI